MTRLVCLPFGLMLQMHMVRCRIDSFILLSSVMVCLKSGYRLSNNTMGEFGVSAFKNFHHLAGTITNEVFSSVVQSQLYCFLAAINVIIEFYFCHCKIPLSKKHRLGMKAFMDDLFVMSSSTKGTQLLLNRCTQVLTWAGMSFRAEKSRCIVIDGGVVKNVTPFTVNLLNSEESQVIPSIHTQPVRFLGRRICAFSF